MDKGYNDLEATIERLEFRNAKLHNHNEKIEQQIIELRASLANVMLRTVHNPIYNVSEFSGHKQGITW